MENGIYKNNTAKYFVKDDLVVMLLNGDWFKTNENFMLGAKKIAELPDEMVSDEFDFKTKREQLKSW